MRSSLSVLACVLIAVGLVSCSSPTICSCLGGGALYVTAADPITSIALSGPPCNGAKFKCGSHADYDSVLAADCTSLDIKPVTVGVCVMDVVVSGMSVHLERQLISGPPAACTSACSPIVAVNGSGYIDLRPLADGGTISDAAP